MSEVSEAIQTKCLAFSDRIIKLRSALPLATVGTQERLLTRSGFSRRREIDREEEREAFNGTTESLVKLYRENQITYEEFTKLPEAEIQRIIDKSRDLEISKERFFQLVDMF